MSIRTTGRLVLATATSVALAGGLLTLSAGPVTAATQAKYADDYNGDGYRDYAFGDGGDSVTVTYGTATGPGTKSKRFTQNSPNIPGTSGDAGGYGDGFGGSLANADLNRDGYADLAIGDRSEKVGSRIAAGAVTILWGAKAGLGAKATRIPVTANSYYGFGAALATGDFNGDGKPDLAVADGVGTVYIYRGGIGPAGTTGKVTKHDHRDLGETTALVAGRVTKDNATDLYVLGQGYKGDAGTQAAWFLRGGATVTSGRLTTYNNSQPDYGPTGVIADFDKNGYGDLAVSDVPHSKSAGSVVILRGSSTGPVSTYSRLTQATSGVATDATKGDAFGYSLSAGDTNRDGYPDLAVSATGEKVGSVANAGGVHVLRGSRSGLTGAGSKWFTRATAGVPGDTGQYQMFGLAVRLRDIDRDGDADLLISGQNGGTNVLLRSGGASGVTVGAASEVGVRAGFPQ
ncbi:FG-GAP and VCBS repeat-containing protein [Streptomyces sp. NPDC020898]|uniref:FG-GAP and VCBS repeat-containing protein n=1 Tax=Streptomyces sp. NPDC020898 TaxID=3365101 RepID=UPI0037AA6A4D